uniref:Uncharacterized protein n=1 Tax=Agaricus bisporus TaxID=5341 RepID=A0A1Q1M955_AGABI|nr:hypothetical protein [Agaricus bisporus]
MPGVLLPPRHTEGNPRHRAHPGTSTIQHTPSANLGQRASVFLDNSRRPGFSSPIRIRHRNDLRAPRINHILNHSMFPSVVLSTRRKNRIPRRLPRAKIGIVVEGISRSNNARKVYSNPRLLWTLWCRQKESPPAEAGRDLPTASAPHENRPFLTSLRVFTTHCQDHPSGV